MYLWCLQVPDVITTGYKWLRAVCEGEFTGVHTDKVFLGRGSPRVLTAWVPLGQVRRLADLCSDMHTCYAIPGATYMLRLLSVMSIAVNCSSKWTLCVTPG